MAAAAATRAGVAIDTPLLSWTELGMHLTVGATLASAKIFVILLLTGPIVLGAAGVAGGTYAVHVEYQSALETVANSTAMEDIVLGTGGVVTGIANAILDSLSGIINGWNIVVPFVTFTWHLLYSAVRFFVVAVFANPQVQYFLVAWFQISVQLFETTVDATNAVIESMRDVVDALPLNVGEINARGVGTPEAADGFLELYDFLLALFVAFAELMIRVVQFLLQIFLPLLYVFIRAVLPALVSLVAPFLTLMSEVLNIITSPAIQRMLLIAVDLLEMVLGLTSFICSFITIGGFVGCVTIATALTVFVFLWEKIVTPMLCIAASFAAGCFTSEDCQDFRTTDCPACSGKNSPVDLASCRPQSIIQLDQGVDTDTLTEMQGVSGIRPSVYKRSAPAMCTAYCTPHTYFYGGQLFDRDADFNERTVAYNDYNNTILGWNKSIAYLGDFYGLTSRYPDLTTEDLSFNGTCPIEGLICAQTGWYCKKGASNETRWAFSPCLVNRCPYTSPWLTPAQQAVAMGDTGLSTPGFDITQVEAWDSVYGVDNDASCATAARTSALPEYFAPMRHCSDARHSVSTNGPCCLFPTSLYYTEAARECDPRVQLPAHCYGPPAPPGSPPCCLNADDNGYIDESRGPRLCRDGQQRGPVYHCSDSRYSPASHKGGCCLIDTEIFDGTADFYPNRGGEIVCGPQDYTVPILECNDVAYTEPATPTDAPLCCRYESDVLHDVSTAYDGWGDNPYVRRVSSVALSNLQSRLDKNGDHDWIEWVTRGSFSEVSDDAVKAAVASHLNQWTARIVGPRYFPDADVLPHCDALHSGAPTVRWMEYVSEATGEDRVRLLTARPKIVGVDNRGPPTPQVTSCSAFTTCCREHPTKSYTELLNGELPREVDTRCGLGTYWSAFNGRRCVVDACNRANASLITHEAYPSGHQRCIPDPNVWSNAEIEYRALLYRPPLMFTTCRDDAVSNFASRSQRAAFHSIGVSHCESTTFDRDSPVVYSAFDAASRLGVRTEDSTSSLWAFQKGPRDLTQSASEGVVDTFPEPLTLSPLIPTPRRDHRSRLTCCLGRDSDSMGEYGIPCSETLGSFLTAPPHCMQREGVYINTAIVGAGATNASNATPTLLPGMAFHPELSKDSYWVLRVLQPSAKSTILGCCWHAQETWGKNRVAPWQRWISHCVEQSQEELRPFVKSITKCAAYDAADSSLARFAAPPFQSKLLTALRDIYERHYRVANEYDDPSFTALPGAPSETCWVFAPGGCQNNATTWWQDTWYPPYTYSSCKARQGNVSAYCNDQGITMHFVIPDPPKEAPGVSLYTCWVFAPEGCRKNAIAWWKDDAYTQYTYSLCEARRDIISGYCGDPGVMTHFVVPEPPQSPPGSCWVFAPGKCGNATAWWQDAEYPRYTYSSCKGRQGSISAYCQDPGIRTHFVHGTEKEDQEGAFDLMRRLKESSQRVEERARADLRLWEVGTNTFFMPCCRDPPRTAKEISELIGVGNFADESVAQRLSVEDAHLFAAIHDSETAIMCRGSDAASETAAATTEAVAVIGACEPDVACFAGSSAYDAGQVLTPANARQCTPFPVSRPWSNQSMCCGLEEWQPQLRGPLPWHPINRGHLGALRCTAVERAVALRRTSLTRDNIQPQQIALGDIRKCSDVVNRTSGRTAENEICCKRSAELCLAKPRSENAFPLVAGPVTPMTQRWRFCQYGCATMAKRYQLAIYCLELQIITQAGQSQNHNERRVAELPLEDSGCVRQRGGVAVGYRTQRMCLASRHKNATTWMQCLPPSGDPAADLRREDVSGTGTCLTLLYPGASAWFFRPTDAEMNPNSPETAGESLRMLVRAWKLSTHTSFADIPPAAQRAISTRWQEHVLRSAGRESAIRVGPLADEMVVTRELARMRVCDSVDRLRSDHMELARSSPMVVVATRLCDDLLPREREDAEGLLELGEAGKDMHVRSAPHYVAVVKQQHEEAVEAQFGASEKRGPRRVAETPCDDDDPSSARRSNSPCWTNVTHSNDNADYFLQRSVSHEQWYSLPWCAAWPQTNYGGCKAPRVAAWIDGVLNVAESGDCAHLDRPSTSTVSACPGGRKCCRGKQTSELVYDIRAHEYAEQQLRITDGALTIGTYDANSWPTGSSWSFKETIRGGWAAIWDLGAQDESTLHMKIVSVPDGKRFYIGLLADELSAEWGQAKPWAWLCHAASTDTAGNTRSISKISNDASDPPGVGTAAPPQTGTSCAWIMRATDRNDHSADIGELRRPPLTAPLAFIKYDSEWPLYQCSPNRVFTGLAGSTSFQACGLRPALCQGEDRMGEGCVENPNYVQSQNYYGRTGQLPSADSSKTDACLHTFPFPLPEVTYENNKVRFVFPDPTSAAESTTSANFFTKQFCHDTCCAPLESLPPEQGWTVSGTKWTNFARNEIQAETCQSSTNSITNVSSTTLPRSYGTCLNCDGSSTQTDLAMTTFIDAATEARTLDATVSNGANVFRDYSAVRMPYTSDPSFPYIDVPGGSGWNCSFASDRVPQGFSYLEGGNTFASTQLPPSAPGSAPPALWNRRPAATFGTTTYEGDDGPTDPVAYPKNDSLPLRSCTSSIRVKMPHVWQRNSTASKGARYDVLDQSSAFWTSLDVNQRRDAEWGVVYPTLWEETASDPDTPIVRSGPMGRGTFVGEWIRAGPHRALASTAPAATNGAWKPLLLNADDYHPCDVTDDGCVVGGSRKCHARSTSAAYIIVVEVLPISSSVLYIDNAKWQQSWPRSFYLPNHRSVVWNGGATGARFEICQATGSHDGQNELSDPHWFLPQNNRTYESPWWAWNNGGRQWNFPIEHGFVVQGHRVSLSQKSETFLNLQKFITVTLPGDWNSATKHRIWPYIDVWWNVGGVAGGIRLRPHADCSLSVVSGSEPESSAYANQLLGLRTDGGEAVDVVNIKFTQRCESKEQEVRRQKQQVDLDAKQTERWMSALRPWIYSRTSDLSANPEPVLNYYCADHAMKVYTQLVSHRMRLRNLEAYLNELGVCTDPVNAEYIDYFVNPAYRARYDAEIAALETRNQSEAVIYGDTVERLLSILQSEEFYGDILGCSSTDRGKHQAACSDQKCRDNPDSHSAKTCSTQCGAGGYCCDKDGYNHERGGSNLFGELSAMQKTQECPTYRSHLDDTIYIKNRHGIRAGVGDHVCVVYDETNDGIKYAASHCGLTTEDNQKNKYVMVDAGDADGGTFYLRNAFTGKCLVPPRYPVGLNDQLIHKDNHCQGDFNKFKWEAGRYRSTDLNLRHVASTDRYLHTKDDVEIGGELMLYWGPGLIENEFYTTNAGKLDTPYICHSPKYDLCVVKDWTEEELKKLVDCRFDGDCNLLQQRIFKTIRYESGSTNASGLFDELIGILEQRKLYQQTIDAKLDRIVICNQYVCPIKQKESDVTTGGISYKTFYSDCLRSSASRRLLDSSEASSQNVLARAVEGLRAHARANKQFSWSKTDSLHREVDAKRTARIAEQRSAIEERRKHELEIRHSEPALATSSPRWCKSSSPGHGNKTRCLDAQEHPAREPQSSQRRFGYSDITKAMNLVNEVVRCFSKDTPDQMGLCFFDFAGSALSELGMTISSGFLSAFEAAKNWMERRALEILEGARDTILALLRDIVSAITGAFGIVPSQAEKMRCEICNNKGILNVDLGDFDLSTCSVFMEESKKCPKVHIFAKLFSPDFITKVVDGTLDVAALIPALLASITAFTDRVLNGGFLFPLLQLGGDLAFVVQFFLTSNHLMDTFRDLVQVFDDFEKNLSDGFTGKGASFNRAPYRQKTTENVNVAQEPGCTSGRNEAGQATGVSSVGNTNCDKTNPQTCGCDVPPPPCTPNAEGSGLTGTGCRYAAVVNGGVGNQATGCPADGLTPPVSNAETASFVGATVTTTTSRKQCTRRIRVPLSRNTTRVNKLADAMGLPPIPGPFAMNGNRNGTASGGTRRLFATAHERQTDDSSSTRRSGAFDAWSNLIGDWQRVHEGGTRILRGAGGLPGVQWARAAASRVLLASVYNNDGCRASDDDPFKCCGAKTYKSPYECCRGLTLCLTPLTNDRTDNLNWTKAQEWMRGDWKECTGLRHPGEIFLYALRRPLYGWNILDANDDASYPATTRTTSGALQWLRFPDDRLPDNELLCFLFNLGAVAPWWFPLFIFGVISPVLIPYSIELLRLSVKCVLPDPNYALTS